MVPTSHDSIVADLDDGIASLRVRNAPVMDAHDLLNNLNDGNGFSSPGTPTVPPVTPVPALVSFDIEWSGVMDVQDILNDTQMFRGHFVRTGATINWSAQAAKSGGFSFTSEAPNPTRNRYSIIARERNGVFFNSESDD